MCFISILPLLFPSLSRCIRCRRRRRSSNPIAVPTQGAGAASNGHKTTRLGRKELGPAVGAILTLCSIVCAPIRRIKKRASEHPPTSCAPANEEVYEKEREWQPYRVILIQCCCNRPLSLIYEMLKRLDEWKTAPRFWWKTKSTSFSRRFPSDSFH